MSNVLKKKCIVVLNGPSVTKIKDFLKDKSMADYDMIAVNRWWNIFETLGLKVPTYTVIGKNSLRYNSQLIRRLPQTIFYGIDKFNSPNYRLLKFGSAQVYGKTVNMIGSLWWTGLYAIQLALKKEYDEIHVFGFTCTDMPDYADVYRRAPIKSASIYKITNFLQELKNKDLMEKITFYENPKTHIFRNLIFTPQE